MAATDMFILMQPVSNTLGDQGVVFAGLQEGSHKYNNEVIEKKIGGKLDHAYGDSSEEVDVTLDRIKGDKSQDQLIAAFRKKEQIKIWMGYKAYDPETNKHDVEFGYAVAESIEDSFDDESSKLEFTLKIKVETVPMQINKLPDSILNPSSAGVTITPEQPGEYTGALEVRTKTSVGA